MASLNGVNYALIAAGEGEKGGKGEANGRVRCLYDQHTFVADVNAISDTITLGAPLPAGARVIGGRIKCGSTGTTGIFNLGYTANGVDVADADAFGASIDPGAAAIDASIGGAGMGKKFTVATQVQAIFTEATDSAAGETLQVWLLYIVD